MSFFTERIAERRRTVHFEDHQSILTNQCITPEGRINLQKLLKA